MSESSYVPHEETHLGPVMSTTAPGMCTSSSRHDSLQSHLHHASCFHMVDSSSDLRTYDEIPELWVDGGNLSVDHGGWVEGYIPELGLRQILDGIAGCVNEESHADTREGQDDEKDGVEWKGGVSRPVSRVLGSKRATANRR